MQVIASDDAADNGRGRSKLSLRSPTQAYSYGVKGIRVL